MDWIESFLLSLMVTPFILVFFALCFCVGYFGSGGKWRDLRKDVAGPKSRFSRRWLGL